MDKCILGCKWIVLSSSDPFFVFYQTKFNVSHFIYGYIFIYVIFQKIDWLYPSSDICFSAATACFIDAITLSPFLLSL